MAKKFNIVDFESENYSAFARKAWRLCLWAGLTLTAIASAFLAGYSETGSRRLALVATSAGANEPSHSAAPAASRRFDAELEARRLSDAVRLLALDRDRLLARIGAIEHDLDDITGSIPRAQPGSRPAGATAPPPMLAPVPSGAPPSTEPVRPPAMASAPAASPPAAAPTVDLPQITSRPTITPPVPSTGAAASTATRTDFGIDLGGAPTIEGLRTLWSSLKEGHEPLLEGLRPVIVLREGSKPGAVELRLVAGPLTNAGVAARLCAALATAGLACQPALFDGQRLALK